MLTFIIVYSLFYYISLLIVLAYIHFTKKDGDDGYVSINVIGLQALALLVGFPPMPTFFTKLALIVSVGFKYGPMLAVGLLVLFLVLWYTLGKFLYSNYNTGVPFSSKGYSKSYIVLFMINMFLMLLIILDIAMVFTILIICYRSTL